MGHNDGRLKDNVYLTSDLSLAAFMLISGFTLLGAIDNETARKEFGLLPPASSEDPETLIEVLTQEFANYRYREYYMRVRDLRYALKDPVRRTL